MNKNNILNIDALSLNRQALVTSALVGHHVEMSNGKLSALSLESLSKVGLTSIEISAIEAANSSTGSGLNMAFSIPENTVPSSDNNPYVKDNWNPEIQRQLHDNNPTQAQQLMREAGILS